MALDRLTPMPGRRSRRALASLALLVLVSSLTADSQPADPAGDEVWITLDREVYATASWMLPLPRLGEAEGVVLTIPGTSLADQVVILGAHQDSTSSGCFSNPNCTAPGADDDASGVATLSEVVRVVLASGFVPQRTVRVMAYAAEEVGLRGSNDIAASYQAAGTNVVAMLQQDMTGYHGSAEDVAFISDWTNATLTAFLVDLLETYQPGLLWTSAACGYACSDHAPWHNRGYPAAFAFEARFGQYNPTIHTTSDTVATLGNSAAHAAKFARLAAAFLIETSLDSNPTLFADGFESGDTSAWSTVVP